MRTSLGPEDYIGQMEKYDDPQEFSQVIPIRAVPCILDDSSDKAVSFDANAVLFDHQGYKISASGDQEPYIFSEKVPLLDSPLQASSVIQPKSNQ